MQGQSAVNTQIVELLRQWQRSEEGRMAQKWYREGKKLLILRRGQPSTSHSAYPIYPPEELIQYFSQQAHDEEDSVQHSSSYSESVGQVSVDQAFTAGLTVTRTGLFHHIGASFQAFDLVLTIFERVLESRPFASQPFYYKFNPLTEMLAAAFQLLVHMMLSGVDSLEEMAARLGRIFRADLKECAYGAVEASRKLVLDKLPVPFGLPFSCGPEHLDLVLMLAQSKEDAAWRKDFLAICSKLPVFALGKESAASEQLLSSDWFLQGTANICKVLCTIQALEIEPKPDFFFRPFAAEALMACRTGPDPDTPELRKLVLDIHNAILRRVEEECSELPLFENFRHMQGLIGPRAE